MSTDSKEFSKEFQRSTKRLASLSTLVYVLLFIPMAMFAVASIMVFDAPDIPIPVGLSIIFIFCWVPISIPVSLYLIWSRYLNGVYKKCRFYCTLPILTVVIVVILNALIEISWRGREHFGML